MRAAKRRTNSNIFSRYSGLISEVNRLEAMQAAWEQSLEGRAAIAKRNEEHNAKVLADAEKIYNAYLSEGIEKAEERKAIYIKRNSK